MNAPTTTHARGRELAAIATDSMGRWNGLENEAADALTRLLHESLPEPLSWSPATSEILGPHPRTRMLSIEAWTQQRHAIFEALCESAPTSPDPVTITSWLRTVTLQSLGLAPLKLLTPEAEDSP